MGKGRKEEKKRVLSWLEDGRKRRRNKVMEIGKHVKGRRGRKEGRKKAMGGS